MPKLKAPAGVSSVVVDGVSYKPDENGTCEFAPEHMAHAFAAGFTEAPAPVRLSTGLPQTSAAALPQESEKKLPRKPIKGASK